MAWIESHQGLAHHPKTKRFARELDESIPSAIGRLHLLWWWALEYAQDGSLEKFDQYDIAEALMWKDMPDQLIAALKVSGWIDEDMYVHDWHDYAGRLIAQREKNAERMKETRAKRKSKQQSNVHEPLHERVSHVQGYQPNQQYQHNTNNSTEHANEQTMPSLENESELKLDDYCQEIELQMTACGANPNYIVQGEALDWVKKFHGSNVPISFIRSSIVQAYARKKEISTFTYIAKIIKDDWARELQKREPVEPLSFHVELSKSRDGPKVDRDFLEQYRMED